MGDAFDYSEAIAVNRIIFGQAINHFRPVFFNIKEQLLVEFNKASFYKPLIELAAERGVSSHELFNLAQADQYKEAKSPLLRLQLWENILKRTVELTGDTAIGLHYGKHVNITSLGTLGFAVMSCNNLEEVLRLVIRYHPILNTEIYCELFHEPHSTILRANLKNNHYAQQHVMFESTFSTIIALGEYLLNRSLFDIELHLNYPPPEYQDMYSQVFSMPVLFNQEHCQLVVNKNTLLQSKLKTANPSGRVVFKQQCELMLRKLNTKQDIAAKVQSLLMHSSGHFPDINHVARELCMSERTLRRRLKEEGTNFRQVFDEVRNVLACEYLTTTKITVSEIANLLDYTECVNFRRAFVRWNEMTPNQYRTAHSSH